MARRGRIYRKQQSTMPSLHEALPFVAPLRNQQTNSFFNPASTLPQLDISQPNDAHEREAEAVAERVSSAESASTGKSEIVPTGSESGFRLQTGLREQMESDLGNDFSAVRLHTDSRAAQMSNVLNALAFTQGNDIYFGAGQYNPSAREGKKLLAHELTHVTQQQTSIQPKRIQRAVADADVEAEYAAWAAANKKTTDKTKDDYPFDVWDFIRPQIADTSMEPLPKPKEAKLLKAWTEAYEKAEIVARWLLAIRASATASDSLKDQADVRGLMVLDTIARAGMVTQAMNQASGLSADKRKSLYETVLKNPKAASPAELVKIIAFQGSSLADPASVPIVQSLTNGNANDLKKLSVDQTKAIFGVLFKMYGNKEPVVKAIAEVLMFNPAIRVAVSDAMMKGDIGNKELLFAVLKHPYFIEPEYGATLLPALVPTGKTNEEYDTERMKTDMPWVYTYKQKYYVQYLIDLAKSQSITIPAPATLNVASLKKWLEDNTEKIGEAAKSTYPTNPTAVFDIYRNIADVFFYHIPHDRDVEPNLEGKINHLKPGAPSKERFEADCDVFATYAMRLFYNAGFEPVGYLAIVPIGAFSGRAAHVAALMRKDNAYYVINNKGILDPQQTETKPNDKKQDALKTMFKLALRDAYGDPLPTQRNVFYEDAGAKGQMTKAFKDQDSSLLRNDIP